MCGWCALVVKTPMHICKHTHTTHAYAWTKTYMHTQYHVDVETHACANLHPERILPSTDEFPTEEPVLRTLPDLPAGLPSEVHKLIAR